MDGNLVPELKAKAESDALLETGKTRGKIVLKGFTPRSQITAEVALQP